MKIQISSAHFRNDSEEFSENISFGVTLSYKKGYLKESAKGIELRKDDENLFLKLVQVFHFKEENIHYGRMLKDILEFDFVDYAFVENEYNICIAFNKDIDQMEHIEKIELIKMYVRDYALLQYFNRR